MQNFMLISVILLTGLKPVPKKNAPKKTAQNGLKWAKTRKKKNNHPTKLINIIGVLDVEFFAELDSSTLK